MKKRILVCFLLLLGVIAIMAQSQDPWIGTWTSESFKALDIESDGNVYIDYRYVIKITKSDDDYFVRAKTIKVSDPKSTIYNDAYGIKNSPGRIEGNSMFLESRRDKIPFYVNGCLDSYSNTTSYFKLTMKNGVLHCSFYKYVVESYDKNMRYEYTNTFGLHEQYPGPCVERDLYNDEW